MPQIIIKKICMGCVIIDQVVLENQVLGRVIRRDMAAVLLYKFQCWYNLLMRY